MFGQTPGATWNFESPAHTEALSRLLYVAEQGEPFVLLVGARGTGKTTLLRQVQSECSRFGHSAVLINVAALDDASFLWHLCGGLSIALRGEQSRTEMLAAIRDEIAGRALCQHETVVILDDLHRAAEDLSPLIQFLSALNGQTEGAVSVVAAAEPAPAMSCTTQSALRVELNPLSDAESKQFASGLLQSKQIPSTRITSEALDSIADFGQGSPARLARLCEMLKVAVSTTPDLKITADVVEVLTEETLMSTETAW